MKCIQSFGIDAADINRDGYKDIVCGKYFYLNIMSKLFNWKAPGLDLFTKESK